MCLTAILMSSDRSPPSLNEDTGPRTVTDSLGNGRWQEVIAPGPSCLLSQGGGRACPEREGKSLSSLSLPPNSAALAKVYFYQLCIPLS